MSQKLYWYEYRLRPFGIGCQPHGHVEYNAEYGYWGKVAYDRPLTEKEINDYELRFIEEGQY